MHKDSCNYCLDRSKPKGVKSDNRRLQRHLTQQQLAERLHMQQAAVSKMENQTDMHISTLQRMVAGMGGKLKLVAEFPDEEIVINQFEMGSEPVPQIG